jgi:UDP-N-acetyl-D-glucosamine dehydrogenase
MDHELLLARLRRRQATVGIVGLGYVGLPLAMAFHKAGFRVRGFDVDVKKTEALAAGRSYIRHIPHGEVEKLRTSGRFEASTDMAGLRACHAVVLCVPTPLTRSREPDLSYIVATCEALVDHLRPGRLVVLESTTYPGTTAEVVGPILERAGLRIGTDLLLAFSPEREDPGNARYTTTNIPKVLGADDRESRAAAEALYAAAFAKVVPVSSSRAAELTKLLENIFRSVNIALVNELKMLCDRMGVDVWEVIEAAATKPFGFMPFYPGPGLGGHCIPIDPFYLTWKAREFGFSTRFIELAGEINTAMPHYVVSRLMDGLNDRSKALKGSRVLVLGVAYKRDIDDTRESPSLEIIDLLEKRGAVVDYHDPFVPALTWHDSGRVLHGIPLTAENIARQDAVVVVTDHSTVDYGYVLQYAHLVVDTRNATSGLGFARDRIVKA